MSLGRIFRKKHADGGFTLIEVVVASLLGAMVISGAFIILLIFRQQTRIAWAERTMDQYMAVTGEYLTRHLSSALAYSDNGVIQNDYAVWNLRQGDLTKDSTYDTRETISGSRTEGLLIDGKPFDPHFPHIPSNLGRRGVPMWDRRDSFELLYLGIEHSKGSTNAKVDQTQIIVTMRMRYRHQERTGLGFLYGGDYARTHTFQTRSFLRNRTVENPRPQTTGVSGPTGSGGFRGSGALGWTLASGKTAEEYLTEKWNTKQSLIRPTTVH
jgi:prepilin-type N-terminal cleavage/methylation domain-containing protein